MKITTPDTCVDTAGGATLQSCEETPPDPGLPESGGSAAVLRQDHSRTTSAMMFEPAATAMYCLPSNAYVIGDAFQV